jgi:hypothetical protein
MNCTNVSSINLTNLGVKILKPYAGCRFLKNNFMPTDNFNITRRGPELGPPLTVKRSPLNTRLPNTIDNVKAKIDNVGQDSRRGGVRTPVKTHTGKTSSLRPVGSISDQFPTRGIPPTSLRLARQVSASHYKYPPRTTSLHLARGVSALHEKSPPRTRSLRFARDISVSHEKSQPRTRSPRLRLVRGP